MRNQEQMKQTAEQRRTRIGALCAAVAVLSASPLQELGADEEYEWDPAWGLHEEEWYDPSDWFNDDGAVDVEELDDAWGYDYDYYGDDFWASPDYSTTSTRMIPPPSPRITAPSITSGSRMRKRGTKSRGTRKRPRKPPRTPRKSKGTIRARTASKRRTSSPCGAPSRG